MGPPFALGRITPKQSESMLEKKFTSPNLNVDEYIVMPDNAEGISFVLTKDLLWAFLSLYHARMTAERKALQALLLANPQGDFQWTLASKHGHIHAFMNLVACSLWFSQRRTETSFPPWLWESLAVRCASRWITAARTKAAGSLNLTLTDGRHFTVSTRVFDSLRGAIVQSIPL